MLDLTNQLNSVESSLKSSQFASQETPQF